MQTYTHLPDSNGYLLGTIGSAIQDSTLRQEVIFFSASEVAMTYEFCREVL